MDQTQQLKEDEVIRKEIIQIMSKMDTNVRPNKLRKIVCKNITGITWTQYQTVLDKMVNTEGRVLGGVLGGSGDDIVLQTVMDDNELMICPIRSSSSRSRSISAVDNKELSEDKNDSRDGGDSEKYKNSITIEVPLAIVHHLTKKGRSKQKSLEKNSKTQLEFSKDAVRIVKKGRASVKNGTSSSQQYCFDLAEKTKITIRALAVPLQLQEDGENESHDYDTRSKKYLKTAKVMIDQMIKAFQQHPDHFYPKKVGGGTFEEQDEAKKKKLQASLSHSRNSSSKKWKNKKDGGGVDDDKDFSRSDRQSSGRTKKRQRKFY